MSPIGLHHKAEFKGGHVVTRRMLFDSLLSTYYLQTTSSTLHTPRRMLDSPRPPTNWQRFDVPAISERHRKFPVETPRPQARMDGTWSLKENKKSRPTGLKAHAPAPGCSVAGRLRDRCETDHCRSRFQSARPSRPASCILDRNSAGRPRFGRPGPGLPDRFFHKINARHPQAPGREKRAVVARSAPPHQAPDSSPWSAAATNAGCGLPISQGGLPSA